MAYVRYIVSDVQKAVDFYSAYLNFTVQQQFPAMAILKRDDLTLWLAGPQASASRPMPDGRMPEPGGWNRFVVETHDLAAMVAKLKAAGVRFRNEIVSGPRRAADLGRGSMRKRRGALSARLVKSNNAATLGR